jgi:dipeptidyl aminopeptidase/acylaminoacyl peptidase
VTTVPRTHSAQFRAVFLLFAALIRVHTASLAAAAPEKRELTPAAALGTVRVMDNQSLPGDPLGRAAVSPDGTRYVLRLARGDAARNGVWVDILTGSLSSLAAAARPITCAHLFSTGLGLPRDELAGNFDADPGNLLRWVNDYQVTMLWSDEHQVHQALLIDLNTCITIYLTHSNTNVFTFGMGPNGTLLYDVKLPRDAARSQQLLKRGFAVKDSSDGWGILQGDMDGSDADAVPFNNSWLLRTATGGLRPVPIAGRAIDTTSPISRTVTIAPDGRLAVVVVGTLDAPPVWDQYTDPQLKRLLAANHANPGRIQLQLVVIDLNTGRSHTLWTAPKAGRTQAIWSPRSDTVLVLPTFLPIVPDIAPQGLTGFAAATVDARTGAHATLPIDLTARVLVSAAWLTPDYVKISTTDALHRDARTECFQRIEHAWTKDQSISPRCAEDSPTHEIHLETRQSQEKPPQIFAVDSKKHARLILDTNPGLLRDYKLGRVERISGTLPSGQAWLGQLIYPADYVPGRRYPLLIQSLYGIPWGDDEFTLDGTWGSSGMGLGPSIFAAYPGQLLASRNFAVLTLEVVHRSVGVQEPEEYELAFETVAQQLAASGLTDRNKVALAGFSRNGYFVEYTLAHSKFPFAAAIAADNYDPSYFQAAMNNWTTLDAAQNGGDAFGPGLQQWILHAPGFNAEHINAPLLTVGQDTGAVFYIIGSWEVFSRLRHLHKPVEMYLMPDIDAHPSHNPQNPRQIMAIQERVIDWLSFWLLGREDSSPQKLEQYAHWHKMRDNQAAAPTP